MEKIRLSVVLPTYNCRRQMARHLASMATWADLADEIVIVDSRSTDGTLEVIRNGLRHPNLRIIERDRGLYESWNEGIAATTGDWVYISTAGDTIEREHLLHLLDLGESSAADVVISAPTFVHKDGSPHRDLDWPPTKLLSAFGRGRPFIIYPEATQFLAFQNCPNALLGSSAADLYRGSHLRARPFPDEYGVVGDTAWIMRYGHETRLALTPSKGSTFCIHEKETKLTPEGAYLLYLRLLECERKLLMTKSLGQHSLLGRFFSSQELPQRTKQLWVKKRSLWHARENHFVNKLQWIGTTLNYLWHSAAMKLRERNELAELGIEKTWFKHLES